MPTLEVRNLSMQFPAVRALDDVSLRFDPGEIHGVIGENGAGKSTLMRILSGLQIPTAGSVLIDGEAVHFRGVRNAESRGIAMIHQELNLIDELTVAENIYLGREPRRGIAIDRKTMRSDAARLLSKVNAKFSPESNVADLSIAEQQLVEVAKALSLNAEIMIMDEPTAVLSEAEATALFALIRELRENGVAVIYISHRLQEVCDLCDRITVLRDGRIVGSFMGGECSPEVLADAMVGRPIADFFPPLSAIDTAERLLEVSDFCVEGWISGITFTVGRGEILGIAGLVGSGRTELCEAIAGIRRPRSGTLALRGHAVRFASVLDAKRAGVAYVSEDRKALGLLLALSVTDNLTLANLDSFSYFVDARTLRDAAERDKEKFDIRVGSLDDEVVFLSGGNQQKVSVAKWLETHPKVLILDEPTRGVDVGAKRQMYDIIVDLAKEGMGCIVVSSELQEIIGLCHRAIVLREGKLMGEVNRADMTEENLMRLAAGVGV